MAKPTDIRPLRDHEVSRSLGDRLIEVADDIRQLYTHFGLRPYRVFMVWVGWTADVNGDGKIWADELQLEDGLEGVGRAVLLRQVELLPTPLVQGMSGVAGNLEPVGVTEQGQVTVSQISMSYTEDQLVGLIPPFRDPKFPDSIKPGVSFFYEIQENRPARYILQETSGSALGPTDKRSPRRRFHLAAAPSRQADAFHWTISLVRADGERDRDGSVAAVEGTSTTDDP